MPSVIPLFLNRSPIVTNQTVKYLGIEINATLNLNVQINIWKEIF